PPNTPAASSATGPGSENDAADPPTPAPTPPTTHHPHATATRQSVPHDADETYAMSSWKNPFANHERVPPQSEITSRPQQPLALRRFPVPEATRPVVAAELIAVHRVAVLILVELRCVLDLVFHAIHEDGLGIEVDVAKHTCRQQHLLAEDPRPGIDDDE